MPEEQRSNFQFPSRAPVQFWMMSTFALFVGIAVVLVASYAVVSLRSNFKREASADLLREAASIANRFSADETVEQQRQKASALGEILDLHITVFMSNEVVIDLKGAEPFEHDDIVNAPPTISELIRPDVLTTGEWEDSKAMRYVYAAAPIPGRPDHIVRIGKIDTLEQIFRRMLLTLLSSMAFALLLALIGAWIAAQRVNEPLRSLTDTAQRINEGHYEEPIQVETRAAEFQDLSISLNGMANRFQNDITKLQRLISIQNEFLGNVSHEVRNPIFAVSGYLEALGSESLGQEQRVRYSEKGVANLERLNTLFGDLVEIAKLEYREDVLHPEVFSMNEMCQEVLETLKPNAIEKDIRLLLEGPPNIEVNADRNRIRQVVTNLVENAVAYSDGGSVKTSLTVDKSKLVVMISDNGQGISPEHLERIFDRFYRVDPARARKSGGSGLGLSIVKQILHAHGEAINVESRKGEGTKFWFSLPLADAN